MGKAKVKVKGKVSTGGGKKTTAGKTGKRLYRGKAKLTGHINDGRK